MMSNAYMVTTKMSNYCIYIIIRVTRIYIIYVHKEEFMIVLLGDDII